MMEAARKILVGCIFLFDFVIIPPPVARADAFVFPLDTPRRALSASFGEYRTGRLHSGIDFATFGRVGIPVLAVDEGRVYRIRTSAGGYGNVLYLEHPNGRRTVYAHLQGFAPRLAALLPRAVHPLGGDENGEAMEVYPSGPARVRKGEIVGWTGEAGIGLPHFHFELRDAADRPLNPIFHGVIKVEDRVPPVIDEVIIEAADEASTVQGGAFPVSLDPAVRGATVLARGRCRVLARVRDEDGRLGGTLALDRLKLSVGGTAWSEIRMDGFTFGRDREAVRVYDHYRSGFGPTVFVYDLTARPGSAELVSGRGFVEAPAPDSSPVEVVIEVRDMKGNPARFAFSLGGGDAPPAEGPDVVHISRAGLAWRRSGRETRITAPGSGLAGNLAYAVVVAARQGGGYALALAGDATLSGVPAGERVYSLSGPAPFPVPAQAVSTPLLLGPYGWGPGRDLELSLPAPASANGLASFHNGAWRWQESVRQGDRFAATLVFLSPVVPVRDTAPPEIRPDTTLPPGSVLVLDDFSGVDGENVRVFDVTQGRDERVKGRYDGDRRSFRPDRPAPEGRTWRVEASDRAGNRSIRLLVIKEDTR